MVVLGDFNLSRVKWDFQDVLHWLPMEPESDSTKSTASKLRNILAPLDMKQFYPLHPNKDCLLELLVSNLAVEGSEALDPMVRCDEHHRPADLSKRLYIPTYRYIDYMLNHYVWTYVSPLR